MLRPGMHAARISFVDSHTEGEPTRVVVGGAPAFAGRTVAEQAADFAANHDWFRSATVNEPRGNDVLVGAVLVPSADPAAAAGVIFYNNVGLLGMCGHGTIGVVRTLAHLGRVRPGVVRLETPVGTVEATLHASAPGEAPAVDVANVRSYVHRQGVVLALPGGRTVHGDIAWGGNGFFLCEDHGERVELGNLAELTRLSWEIRAALEEEELASIDGRPVDHVELFAHARDGANDSRSFVLCPGGAYDRSPCGTGTSAKLACLAARGELAPGAVWRQESVIGSVFEAWYAPAPEGGVLPTVRGRAWITGEGTLVVEPSDPYRHGIPFAANHPLATSTPRCSAPTGTASSPRSRRPTAMTARSTPRSSRATARGWWATAARAS
jgi:4-hydroxyproline epimerase